MSEHRMFMLSGNLSILCSNIFYSCSTQFYTLVILLRADWGMNMWESFQIQLGKFSIRAFSVYCVYPQHSVVVWTDNRALTLSHAQSTFYNTPLT